MSSITQTQNMTNEVTTYFMNFMENSKALIDDDAYDALKSLWMRKPNQTLLGEAFSSIEKPTRRSTGRTNSSGKKVKDPNKPKRGNSAYIFFCKDKREEVKDSMTDSTPRTVTKELGARWNTAKAAGEISKYEKMAKDDKVRYQDEMADYTPPTEDEWAELTAKTKKKSKKKKKRTGPKRACSSYIFFCKEMRATIKEENPTIESKEIMKELGVRWNTAKTAGEVEKWVKMAADDKVRYKEESESESEVEEAEEKPQKKSLKRKATKEVELEEEVVEEEVVEEEVVVEKKKSKKKSSKKKKKKVLAMKYWKEQVGEEIAKECGLTGSELTKEFSKRWKALGKGGKAKWKQSAIDASSADDEDDEDTMSVQKNN